MNQKVKSQTSPTTIQLIMRFGCLLYYRRVVAIFEPDNRTHLDPIKLIGKSKVK